MRTAGIGIRIMYVQRKPGSRLMKPPISPLKIPARLLSLRAKSHLKESIWLGRAMVDRSLRENPDIEWLFILTFPNGGSTALVSLLANAERAVTLQPNGEGQWLVPSMSVHIKRWDPSYHPNYAVVKAIWLNRIAKTGRNNVVVIEKSPPNLCRFEKLLDSFKPMKMNVLTYSRDPYATCASWHGRYGKKGIAESWGFDTEPTSEAEYFRELGRIWIKRALLLGRAGEIYGHHIRYEDFCSDPKAVLGKITSIVPALSDANPEGKVTVKDYEPQTIRNMNERQISSLTPAQIEAISLGLGDSPPIVENFGYKIL